jgi:transketolase
VLNPRVTDPELILIATGSEVQHIVAAEKTLAGRGVRTRLVSMPSWELFEAQPAEYRDSVLPPGVTARLAVEAGVPQGWRRWVGDKGATITIDHYGASAPYQRIMQEFGFTAENVVAQALKLLARED